MSTTQRRPKPYTDRHVTFDAPTDLISLNDRHHHHKRADLVRHWRQAACYAAIAAVPATGPRYRAYPPAHVHITLPVPDRRRRDPHNYYPTVKAIIDGLVDACYWDDDNPDFVITHEPALVPNTSRHRTVHIRITPRNPGGTP